MIIIYHFARISHALRRGILIPATEWRASS